MTESTTATRKTAAEQRQALKELDLRLSRQRQALRTLQLALAGHGDIDDATAACTAAGIDLDEVL